jgi:hypothetical protein
VLDRRGLCASRGVYQERALFEFILRTNKPSGDSAMRPRNGLAYWVAFGVCQIVGCVVPLFGNVHMNIAPILVGALLLLPGDLIGERLFGVSGAVSVGAIVLINFAVWYAFRKIWPAVRSNALARPTK